MTDEKKEKGEEKKHCYEVEYIFVLWNRSIGDFLFIHAQPILSQADFFYAAIII